MIDCHEDIRRYHAHRVALTHEQDRQLRKRRDTNRERVTHALKRKHAPEPERFVSQGSHAMGTVVQEPNNAYDIDDGVVFARESLRGPRGGRITALAARKLVRDAVDNGSFARAPETRKHCVRVFYNDGPRVDIPVYRRSSTWNGETYELASTDWKPSSPEGVNAWFEACVQHHMAGGRPYFRELIRLVKSIGKNRPSYSLPSGFVLTVLVNECYSSGQLRLDVALHELMASVYRRFSYGNQLGCLMVRHPVVNENLIDVRDTGKNHQTPRPPGKEPFEPETSPFAGLHAVGRTKSLEESVAYGLFQ